MKRLYAVLALTGMTTLYCSTAQPLSNCQTPEAQLAPIEKVLLKALANNSEEALMNAICNLRRLKSTYPDHNWDPYIIPLMHVLNEERNDPRSRIIAAGILYELRSDRGDFAICRNGIFTEDTHVRQYCAMLSRHRSWEKVRLSARKPSD